MGIGEIKANYHRPLAGDPKAITVKREGSKWWLYVRCVNVPAMPLERTGCEIGIDLGVVNQIATSDGELNKGQHFGAKAQQNLAQAQRSLATKHAVRTVGDVKLKRSCDCIARSRISEAMRLTS